MTFEIFPQTTAPFSELKRKFQNLKMAYGSIKLQILYLIAFVPIKFELKYELLFRQIANSIVKFAYHLK